MAEDMIGDRLRRLRRERTLTQEQLAELSGFSRDLIRKLEQGRKSSARISTLAALADALDVDLSDLLGKRPHLDPDRQRASVLAVRNTLVNPDQLPGIEPSDSGEPTPPERLAAMVKAAWEDYWSGEFSNLTATLPRLIGEARLTHRVLGVQVAGLLAQCYQLASCLMVHLGQDDVAAIGAERALHAAYDGDDELQWATLNGTYSWVLLHQGRLRESEDHAAKVAAQIEPPISKATQSHLVVWGGLVLTAMASAAADERRRVNAEEYISLARAASARMPRDRNDYWVMFGPTQVAMQTTHAYARLKEPKLALDAASSVRREDLLTISYGSHLLDVSEAHVEARHGKAAVATLERARDTAPLWFRHQGIARSLVGDLVERERRVTPALRGLARAVNVD